MEQHLVSLAEDNTIKLNLFDCVEGMDFHFPPTNVTLASKLQARVIDIVVDNATETMEWFTVVLDGVLLVNGSSKEVVELQEQEYTRIVLNPDTASITILEDDVTTGQQDSPKIIVV